MNQLHEKILQQCRDEVASKEEWGKPTLEETLTHTVLTQPKKLEARMYVIEQKAALLAMEELAGFESFKRDNRWILDDVIDDLRIYFHVDNEDESVTEEQLYEEYGRTKG